MHSSMISRRGLGVSRRARSALCDGRRARANNAATTAECPLRPYVFPAVEQFQLANGLKVISSRSTRCRWSKAG